MRVGASGPIVSPVIISREEDAGNRLRQPEEKNKHRECTVGARN